MSRLNELLHPLQSKFLLSWLVCYCTDAQFMAVTKDVSDMPSYLARSTDFFLESVHVLAAVR